jgi:hypothetical protein
MAKVPTEDWFATRDEKTVNSGSPTTDVFCAANGAAVTANAPRIMVTVFITVNRYQSPRRKQVLCF